MFGRGPTQIVSIDRRTGGRELLTNGPGLKISPSVLPAGRFAYVTPAGVTFGARQSETIAEFGRPAWSQDGSMLVFHEETKKVIQPMKDLIADLDRRVKQLEARPTQGVGCEWAGVFQEGKQYPARALVTRRGGLWLSMRENNQTPGMDGHNWKLIVKEGRGHDA